MNNHEYFLELINLKIDNMLTAEEKLELDEHLLTCSDCADRLRMYELLHDFSEDLLISPPEDFKNDVMDKIQSEIKVSSPKRRIASRLIPVVAAAAVLALILYTGVYDYISPKNNMTADSADLQKAQLASESVEDGQKTETALEADADSGFTDAEASSALRKEATTNSTSDSDEFGTASPQDYGDKALFALGGAMPEEGSNLFDTSTAEVGDEVVGFIITEIETDYNDDDSSVHAVFQGEATLSGTLYHDNNELGHWGKFIYFYIDDDCSEFLPYPVDDDRQIWFGFDNYDEAVKMLDTQPGDEGVTVAYQAVIVIDSYTVMQGATEGCNFATLKSVLTLKRLDSYALDR